VTAPLKFEAEDQRAAGLTSDPIADRLPEEEGNKQHCAGWHAGDQALESKGVSCAARREALPMIFPPLWLPNFIYSTSTISSSLCSRCRLSNLRVSVGQVFEGAWRSKSGKPLPQSRLPSYSPRLLLNPTLAEDGAATAVTHQQEVCEWKGEKRQLQNE